MYSCIITVCEYTDYSHLHLYQFCMCILTLLPSTLVALLYVHPRTTAIRSCINTVCTSFNYSHPLVYHYCIHTDYRHILFYHYCMCTLGLQPSTLVSILYMHPRTPTIYSSIITVYGYSDYSHPFLYHDCMCIVIMANHSCIITVHAYSDYSHPLLYQYCMCIL